MVSDWQWQVHIGFQTSHQKRGSIALSIAMMHGIYQKWLLNGWAQIDYPNVIELKDIF